jgi:thioredoxin 1
MAERIGKADFSEKVLQSSLPVIVDFYSDSCVACKRLSPVLAEAEENYEGKVQVYKVNTNYDAELAEEYDVTANPTLLFVAGGEVKDKKQGAMRPAELSAWIDGLL